MTQRTRNKGQKAPVRKDLCHATRHNTNPRFGLGATELSKTMPDFAARRRIVLPNEVGLEVS